MCWFFLPSYPTPGLRLNLGSRTTFRAKNALIYAHPRQAMKLSCKGYSPSSSLSGVSESETIFTDPEPASIWFVRVSHAQQRNARSVSLKAMKTWAISCWFWYPSLNCSNLELSIFGPLVAGLRDFPSARTCALLKRIFPKSPASEFSFITSTSEWAKDCFLEEQIFVWTEKSTKGCKA